LGSGSWKKKVSKQTKSQFILGKRETANGKLGRSAQEKGIQMKFSVASFK